MPPPKIANPRWLWITALIVGVVCIGAFAVAMLSDGEPSRPGPVPVATRSTGRGFGTGLVIGLCAGVGVGLAIARLRPQGRDHSSRSSP